MAILIESIPQQSKIFGLHPYPLHRYAAYVEGSFPHEFATFAEALTECLRLKGVFPTDSVWARALATPQLERLGDALYHRR